MLDKIWSCCRVTGIIIISFIIGIILGTFINMTVLQKAYYDGLDAKAYTIDEQPYDRHVYDPR